MNHDQMLLNAEQTYKMLTGITGLPVTKVKARLTFLRNSHGLVGVKIGADFFYSIKQIQNFIQRKEKECKQKKVAVV